MSIEVYGSSLKLDPEDSLFLGSHDYEPYESKLVMGLIRPTDVIVDVGAMIGYYTVIFAKHAGSGRVYAFEPDPDNFAILTENMRTNGYDHVLTHNAIVGSSTGRGRLWRASSNRGDHHAFETTGREAIEVDRVALDDVIDEPVDLVKIDVQGYEAHVLRGMQGLIERSPGVAMLVEYCPALLIEAGTEPSTLFDALDDFALYEIDEDARTMRPTEGLTIVDQVDPSHGDAKEGYTNLLCVRKR